MTVELCDQIEEMLVDEMDKLVDSAEHKRHGMTFGMIDDMHKLLQSMESIRLLKVSATK